MDDGNIAKFEVCHIFDAYFRETVRVAGLSYIIEPGSLQAHSDKNSR